MSGLGSQGFSVCLRVLQCSVCRVQALGFRVQGPEALLSIVGATAAAHSGLL